MAVLPGIEGLEVTIEVDGQTAKEYDPCDDGDGDPPENLEFHIPDGQPQTDAKPYIVKYIEAKPGVSFQCHVKRLPNFQHRSHHIACEYHIDDFETILSHDETVSSRFKASTWESILDHVEVYSEKQNNFKCCKLRFEKLAIGMPDDILGLIVPCVSNPYC
jgi:hypothetical protein